MTLLAVLLMMSTLPTADPQIETGQPSAAASAGEQVDALTPAATPVDRLAMILDRGARIGDPFPLKTAAKWMKTDRNASKARSIINLAGVAQRQGLDKSPDVVAAVDAFKYMLLADKLMQSLTDTIEIDERLVRSQFDHHPERYDEFEMSHIFFPFAGTGKPSNPQEEAAAKLAAKNEAAAALARLAAGADFGSLARELSKDGETASDGGVLPAILGANIQPRFLDGVRALKDGEISRVIEGDEGYHIILLNRRRHLYSGPARDMIEREIRAREMTRLLVKVEALDVPAK